MDKMIEVLSDISRTNQIRILRPLEDEDIAEKLRQYLFKMGKGIDSFSAKNLDLSQYANSSLGFFQKRERVIKQEIKKRLAAHNENCRYRDIKYFLSNYSGENTVFFISSNTGHTGWQNLFKNNRERIFNLVFKFYILDKGLTAESMKTMNGFEELLFLHSTKPSQSGDTVRVWGQNLLIKYNYHNVLTLTLSRKKRLFSLKDQYSTIDGDDLGELLVYQDKKYYCQRDLDARETNDINFMLFPKDSKDYDKFKECQLYYYQNLMTKLEEFLSECEIDFKPLHFQADNYLKDSFIENQNIESVESLEIINNTGVDLTEDDQQFLKTFLKHQGISFLTFYNSGKTISTYEKVEVEDKDDSCWRITEVVPWSDIALDKEKNYLVFNKLLDEDAGSMAYQGNDNLWYPSTKIDDDDKKKVDFYSQLKRRYNYLETGDFYSMQGRNVSEFKTLGKSKSTWSVLNYTNKKIENIGLDLLRQDTQVFTNGQFLDVEDSISCYLRGQEDSEQWKSFCKKYKIKISPEFQKILIELGIKNWIRKSLINPNFGVSITPQSFTEKEFFTIYVRSPKDEQAKAVAIKFLYKEGYIYIQEVMRNTQEIRRRFQFLRTKRNSEDLKNDQQYFVDESEKLYISCYTDDFYTPTLIGRNGILEGIENGTLKINRGNKGEDSSRLLPVVSYYNPEIKHIKDIQNMICLDLENETFIQYYIPPAQSLDQSIKTGFRVYHLIGKTYSGKPIPTSELIKHPLTALHFSTLTQNVLKISDNSQSSLLQKAAKVLVEN